MAVFRVLAHPAASLQFSRTALRLRRSGGQCECAQNRSRRHTHIQRDDVVYGYLIQLPLHRSAYASLGRVCTLRKEQHKRVKTEQAKKGTALGGNGWSNYAHGRYRSLLLVPCLPPAHARALATYVLPHVP